MYNYIEASVLKNRYKSDFSKIEKYSKGLSIITLTLRKGPWDFSH